ncbi:transcriptional regulator [Cereibacter changlensis JA139]|uniref:Transcriptional regulator n=2 Tax=Cereibacter changlensis TaxID=402884 RepID=A0A2T4JVW8_9RHOB|nr:transcriptional regulator [Cereibacter changlensis]PTE22061.1 transcriptional regulator [Cereibacter changlensis JA139]PZX58689.1 hypothetical protein LX76_00192 [Cereibacter changlensis]
MGRPRTIPDADIHAAICTLLAQGGDKAVSFSSVARVSRLAAPTLVQRYQSREGMIRAALTAAWDGLEQALDAAEMEQKPAALLKQLSEIDSVSLMPATLRDAGLRERAAGWRARVEAALALRLGGGTKGREAASLMFSAWQGQMLWQDAGGRGFKLKEAAKRVQRAI